MTTENTLFPGRPNYTGPTSGWFGLLHHTELFEQSHDVNERIAYVRENKPDAEIPVRLHNMVYLAAVASTCEMCAQLDADYKAKCAQLDAVILEYIKSVMPDCAWDGHKIAGT